MRSGSEFAIFYILHVPWVVSYTDQECACAPVLQETFALLEHKGDCWD